MTDTTAAPPANTATSPAANEAASPAANPELRSNNRKTREGLVVSVAMNKTAVVETSTRVRHPQYNKIVRRRGRLYVHDQNNELQVGDRVRVQETRPLSKLKRWRLDEILERAR